MGDVGQGPSRSRATTFGARSQRSQTSRPPSPPGLERLRSGTYLDDQFHYHHHNDTPIEPVDGDTANDDLGTSEKKSQETDLESGSREEVGPEARCGSLELEDLETGRRLEKVKSSRSVRDANLVSWNGLDDPDNPKNWTMGHKWAATFTGRTFPTAMIIRTGLTRD